jgi:hypothetical protein
MDVVKVAKTSFGAAGADRSGKLPRPSSQRVLLTLIEPRRGRRRRCEPAHETTPG